MSISYNKSVLQGRITAAPELNSTQNNIPFVQFTLAVDRPYQKGKERQADFIRCVAWRQSAEFLCQYAQKGYGVMVEGTLQPKSYEKEGVKVEGYNVVADNVKIDFPPKSAAVPTGSSAASAEASMAVDPPYQPEGDDDLPF